MYPVEIQSLTKSFSSTDGNLEILKGINLELEEGCSIAIVGKSGSGKSTLLHLIGLIDKPTSGSILINGVNTKNMSEYELASLRNKFYGYVFQSNLLLDDFNALDNIAMSALISGEKLNKARERAADLLKELGLYERKNHFPFELSGGEKQRVSLCRALINNPKVILADEPTGSLDEKNASEVEEVLINLTKIHKTSLLLVTHNMDLAFKCDKVYRLSSGVLQEEK